jgi:hypothetical protein
MFRRRPPSEILPVRPVEINIEPWWLAQLGHILEADIKVVQKYK